MVTKAQPAKKDVVQKKPKGKVSKNEDDEPYVASKSAKGKKQENENKIKRPLSAFFHYCNERRVTLKAEEPSLSMGDSTKKMSEEWRNLDAKKRKKYDEAHEKDKERYEREMEASGTRVKKPTTNDNGIKKPLGSYFQYQKDRLESLKKEKPGL